MGTRIGRIGRIEADFFIGMNKKKRIQPKSNALLCIAKVSKKQKNLATLNALRDK
jgi:hypothetical protein